MRKKIDYEILKYEPGIPLFKDRNYTDSLNNEILTNSFLIRTKRHESGVLFVSAIKPIVIHRLIGLQNNNEEYFGWKLNQSRSWVKAKGLDHKFLVSKDLTQGTLKLNIGGPFSADPIFITCSDSHYDNPSKLFEINQ